LRNLYSILACFIIALVLCWQRVSHSGFKDATLKVTDWDALGYYMYLPGLCIYDDVSKLEWFPAIDAQYKMSGGNLYQAGKQGNDKYVFKYLGGVAILQAPFFFTAHKLASHYGYPADGFSQPYQFAIAIGILFYCILSLFLLRWLMLKYFNDRVVAISLLLLCLATNFIQYVAVDAGMSHGWIFALYVLVLCATYKWHKRPRLVWAALIGYIIGLATISRPTEAIMLLIPLLWATHTKEAAKEKWQFVTLHRSHVYIAILTGILGILPQLLYWKSVTGSFIYDVGSSWNFLTPHLRVLLGLEKGWFIYTPATILLVLGMFYMKGQPFRKSVIWFCMFNIYIVISWADWKYGGGYSTRALVQSYPVFALPLAEVVQKVDTGKWRLAFYGLAAYLIFVNLFQVKQYEQTILHAGDMNGRYYSRIYLNANPTPLDMSLLDHDEVLNNESGYSKEVLVSVDAAMPVNFGGGGKGVISTFNLPTGKPVSERWIHVRANIRSVNGFYATYLNADILNGVTIKHTRVRLFTPIAQNTQSSLYEFYTRIPAGKASGTCSIYFDGDADYNGTLEKLIVELLEK
jgi:hypothetical protein